jgi:hypothetical protein
MKVTARSFLGVLVFVALSTVVLMAGCGGDDATTATADGGDDSTGGDNGPDAMVIGLDAAPQMGCSGYPGADPSTQMGSGCCPDGPSHCVPKTAIPPTLQDQFATCSNGLCVPDPIIKAGSMYVPAPCTTKLVVWTLQGVCLSTCINKVATNPQKGLLHQETCGQGELCVPCVDPTNNNTPTGACTLSDIICGRDAGTSDAATEGGVTCPYTGPPILDPTSFSACSPACGGAHCLPAALVPANVQSQLASCMASGQPGFCAPDSFIASAGKGVPKTCASIAGAEGRCLSTCLPQIASEASLLPKDVCADDERCAPCYNPVATPPAKATDPTGACSLACDHPTKPPTVLMCPWTGPNIIDPTTLPACDNGGCSGAHCLPAAEVPTAVQSQLAHCNNNQGFCAPDSLIASANNTNPATCTSIAGAEGRCLSTCLPEVSSQASLLPRATCASNERCVPCYNPVSQTPTAATGACGLGCDHPTKPPTVLTCPWTGPNVIDPSTLPACDNGGCGGAHCLPAAEVPASVQSQLAPCGTGASAGFCAPDPIIATANNFVPTSCTSIAGAEGRCLSTCLPMIAGQENLLPRSTCAANERCAPCYNPVSSSPTTPTGACGLACDHPTKPPVQLSCPWTGPNVIDPSTLPACDNSCGGAHCLPAAEVPQSVRSQLATCGSGANAGYCTPDPIIATANNYVPPTCDPFPGSGAPGRCLSQCLPDVAAKVAAGTLVQSSCTSGNYCVPCADPFTGASTGACTLACDVPPPTWKFPQCCDDGTGALTGTCVPTALVPSGQQSNVNQSGNGNSVGCPSSGANYLCIPDEYLPAPYNNPPLQGCQATFLNFCGVCVSQCIVNSTLNILTQSTCASHHKCVECFAAPSTPGCSTFCP